MVRGEEDLGDYPGLQGYSLRCTATQLLPTPWPASCTEQGAAPTASRGWVPSSRLRPAGLGSLQALRCLTVLTASALMVSCVPLGLPEGNFFFFFNSDI